MAQHADPVFESRYNFCRVDCEECDRIDREWRETGTGKMTEEEIATALSDVSRAIADGWGNP